MTDSSKILIVEDEMISAHNLADNLTDMGYTISDIVKTGDAAIQSVKQNPPDLILMDIQLKGNSTGIDAALSLQPHHIPVIYLTAFVDNKTLTEAARTQPYGYLTKPAKIDDIRSTMEVALSRSREDNRLRTIATEEQRLNELKSHFLAMLAHDLRTPLSVMLASLEIVRQYGEQLSEAKKHKHFKQIRSAIRQMTHQLETVLTAEEVAHGSLPFQPQPLEIVDFFREKVNSFQIVLPANQSLNFQTNCQYCIKQLDSTLLEHIINNLITNAIKYSPDGGDIDIILDCDDIGFTLTVQDQGIGMPETFLENLFKPFERACNVGAIKGTGIGLHIVLQAIQSHQGTINVTSKEGVGSSFVVQIKSLPLQNDTK